MLKTTYCTNCKSTNKYNVEEITTEIKIKNILYPFKQKFAKCNVCNNRIFVDELEDKNEEEFDEYYRNENELITINEIKKILFFKKIESKDLSLFLFNDDKLIDKYLEGQIPNEKNSKILKQILRNL